MGINNMSDDKKSDAGAAASEKPAKEYNMKSPTDVARKGMDEGYATMLCCCVCVCEDPETKDQKCCVCLPIKCGVQGIAASIILIPVVQFLEIFYQLLNDQIEWWYVLVGVGVSIPIIIAFGLTIYFFAEDDDGTRVGMQAAGILVVFSLWIAFVVCAFFAYYLCILSQYKNLYRESLVAKWIAENPDEEEKPLKKDDDAAEEPKDDEADKKEDE